MSVVDGERPQTMKVGWYRDRAAPGRPLYWNGEAWLSNLEGARLAWPAGTPLGSRARGPRVALTIGILAVSYLAVTLVGILLYVASPPPSPGQGILGPTEVVVAVIWFALFSSMAVRVSYRWFDAFLLVVPVYSFVWTVRVVWRVANLPLRDWEPRPEDLTRLLPRARSGVRRG